MSFTNVRIREGRLLLTEMSSEGYETLRDLPKKVEKMGIRIKKWYHIFSHGTNIRIGNRTYKVNTKSLKKYLIRTSVMDEKEYSKHSKVALKSL